MKVFYKQVQLNPTTATDYTDLLNKPQINGVELLGDQDTEQIKVTWFGTQAEFDALGTYHPYTLYIINDGTPTGEQESYLDLGDKPSINGQVLTGNKLSSDLNMYNMEEIDNMLASMRAIKTDTALPATPVANTMYYIGPLDSEGTYDVYLYDSLVNQIYLGKSIQKPYTAGTAIELTSDNKINVLVDNKTIIVNSEGKLESAGLAGDNGEDDKRPLWLDDGTVKAFTHTIFDLVYPVGSIFTSVSHTTAASVQSAFGGTWVAWGSGKVPIGVNTSDTDFNAAEKTGGEKTHKLTVNEMPSHTHNAQGFHGTASGSAAQCMARYHIGSDPLDTNTPLRNTGGDQAHNNLQPYITCYMYKRTA